MKGVLDGKVAVVTDVVATTHGRLDILVNNAGGTVPAHRRTSERRHRMTDREELVDLTIRYATAIDRRQYQLLSTVFTADAELDYGEVGQWTSAAGVIEFMDLAHAGAANTLHRMSNQVITVDKDSATARTYVDALILGPEGSGVNAIGFYDDEAVRTADGWRIGKRKFTSVRLVMVGA